MEWTPLKHINHVCKWFKIKSLESKQLLSPVRNNSAPGNMSAANMPIQATLSFGNIWAVGTLQLGSLATFQSQMSEKVRLPRVHLATLVTGMHTRHHAFMSLNYLRVGSIMDYLLWRRMRWNLKKTNIWKERTKTSIC